MSGRQATQPALDVSDALAMSSVADLTLEILKGIRSDLKNLQDEVRNGFASVNQRFENVDRRFDEVNRRLDETNRRIDATNDRIDGNNERLDSVIKIVGSHHDRLTDRVSRIEDHLGLPHDL